MRLLRHCKCLFSIYVYAPSTNINFVRKIVSAGCGLLWFNREVDYTKTCDFCVRQVGQVSLLHRSGDYACLVRSPGKSIRKRETSHKAFSCRRGSKNIYMDLQPHVVIFVWYRYRKGKSRESQLSRSTTSQTKFGSKKDVSFAWQATRHPILHATLRDTLHLFSRRAPSFPDEMCVRPKLQPYLHKD